MTPRTLLLAFGVRGVVAAFMAGALTVVGCSLLVDFDDSKIPQDDSGTPKPGTDTGRGGGGGGGTDTGTPESGSPDADAAIDTGPDVVDAGDTTIADTGDLGVDTGPVDTGPVDVGIDTAPVDEGLPDLGVDLGVDTGPADLGVDTAPVDTGDAAGDADGDARAG